MYVMYFFRSMIIRSGLVSGLTVFDYIKCISAMDFELESGSQLQIRKCKPLKISLFSKFSDLLKWIDQ